MKLAASLAIASALLFGAASSLAQDAAPAATPAAPTAARVGRRRCSGRRG